MKIRISVEQFLQVYRSIVASVETDLGSYVYKKLSLLFPNEDLPFNEAQLGRRLGKILSDNNKDINKAVSEFRRLFESSTISLDNITVALGQVVSIAKRTKTDKDKDKLTTKPSKPESDPELSSGAVKRARDFGESILELIGENSPSLKSQVKAYPNKTKLGEDLVFTAMKQLGFDEQAALDAVQNLFVYYLESKPDLSAGQSGAKNIEQAINIAKMHLRRRSMKENEKQKIKKYSDDLAQYAHLLWKVTCAEKGEFPKGAIPWKVTDKMVMKLRELVTKFNNDGIDPDAMLESIGVNPYDPKNEPPPPKGVPKLTGVDAALGVKSEDGGIAEGGEGRIPTPTLSEEMPMIGDYVTQLSLPAEHKVNRNRFYSIMRKHMDDIKETLDPVESLFLDLFFDDKVDLTTGADFSGGATRDLIIAIDEAGLGDTASAKQVKSRKGAKINEIRRKVLSRLKEYVEMDLNPSEQSALYEMWKEDYSTPPGVLTPQDLSDIRDFEDSRGIEQRSRDRSEALQMLFHLPEVGDHKERVREAEKALDKFFLDRGYGEGEFKEIVDYILLAKKQKDASDSSIPAESRPKITMKDKIRLDTLIHHFNTKKVNIDMSAVMKSIGLDLDQEIKKSDIQNKLKLLFLNKNAQFQKIKNDVLTTFKDLTEGMSGLDEEDTATFKKKLIEEEKSESSLHDDRMKLKEELGKYKYIQKTRDLTAKELAKMEAIKEHLKLKKVSADTIDKVPPIVHTLGIEDDIAHLEYLKERGGLTAKLEILYDELHDDCTDQRFNGDVKITNSIKSRRPSAGQLADLKKRAESVTPKPYVKRKKTDSVIAPEPLSEDPSGITKEDQEEDLETTIEDSSEDSGREDAYQALLQRGKTLRGKSATKMLFDSFMRELDGLSKSKDPNGKMKKEHYEDLLPEDFSKLYNELGGTKTASYLMMQYTKLANRIAFN